MSNAQQTAGKTARQYTDETYDFMYKSLKSGKAALRGSDVWLLDAKGLPTGEIYPLDKNALDKLLIIIRKAKNA